MDTSLDELVEVARRQYQDEKFSEALSTCEKAEAGGIESADLAAIHSKSLLALKRNDEAEAFLTKMLAQYPMEDSLYYGLVFLKVRQRSLEEALSIVDDAERLGVRTGRIAAAKALIMLKQMKFKEAIVFLEKEIGKFPHEAYLHYYLGIAYSQTLRLTKADSECRKAIELDKSLARPIRRRRWIRYVYTAVALVYMIVVDFVFRANVLYMLPLLFVIAAGYSYNAYLRFRNRLFLLGLLFIVFGSLVIFLLVILTISTQKM